MKAQCMPAARRHVHEGMRSSGRDLGHHAWQQGQQSGDTAHIIGGSISGSRTTRSSRTEEAACSQATTDNSSQQLLTNVSSAEEADCNQATDNSSQQQAAAAHECEHKVFAPLVCQRCQLAGIIQR